MINKAFGIVCDKVEQALASQNFTKQKVDNSNSNEMAALFTSENIAYSILYDKEKMHMIMRSCVMTDEGPDNEWKVMATWMFDPGQDTEKEAVSIANDFAEAVSLPSAIKKSKQTKKKKNSDEGSADPLFLAKRFVNFFPELKEEIRQEEENHEAFRGVTFTREHIVPKIMDFSLKATRKEIGKMSQLLSAQYQNGDMDTRSIITIVILNSIDEKYEQAFLEEMSDTLKKAWASAKKFKNKKVKPEKRKQPKATIADRLGK